MPKAPTRLDAEVLVGVDRAADDVDRAVLDVAATHLAEVGLEGFAADEVARRSGIGRSTLYRRFADRNALLSATVAHQARAFFADLSALVEPIGDPVDRVVAAFAHGLALAEELGLAELVRTEPLVLELLTVDAAPLLEAASEQLVVEAERAGLRVDASVARPVAEVLVRLAISFVVTPQTVLDLAPDGVDGAVRAFVGPLLSGGAARTD